MRGRLKGTKAYLAGGIDRVPDGGRGWRKEIGGYLRDHFGVVVLDPTDKPIDLAAEDEKSRAQRRKLKLAGDFKKLVQEMKLIRQVDLRMVDFSDFVVVYLDLESHACGTYEELFWANRLKRPVFAVVDQGKINAPDWLFGCLPLKHIFGSWGEMTNYLGEIDQGRANHKRFLFFNDLVHPKVVA